jgi:membrane-bound ClpP family serine protease
LWVAKDIALFPVLWRAYDWDPSSTSVSLNGDRGIVVRRIDPEGYIRIRGELWRAKISRGIGPIEKGEWVRVTDVEGLTLHVRPLAAPHPKP